VFEPFVKDPRALERHRNSPLAEERLRYLDHCAELGMAHSTLRTTATYLLTITDYLRLGERPDDLITPKEIEAQASRWANRRTRSQHERGGRDCFLSHATRWLQFLGRWQQPPTAPHPYADRVAAFADSMHRERGLSPHTVSFRCRFVQEFLDRLCVSRPLEEVTPAHLDDALSEKVKQGGCARTSVQTYASALRSFFRFAQAQAWCRQGLAEAIKAPRVFAQETLPCGPGWDDVQRLLATAAGDAPKNIRDRAILLLLAVYGCRAGEVARLRLEDLEWQKELIHIRRSKPSRTQTYPLSRPVGDAILRYLQRVRPPSSHREVFLRLKAPLRPLHAGALWSVVSHRLRGLGVTLSQYGPHALRHACATHLLEQGFTLKQIGSALHQGGPHRAPRRRRPRVGRSTVNLQQLIEQHVTFRQTLGERFKTNAFVLRAFARVIGVSADLSEVRPEQVSAFLAGVGPITSTWHRNYTVLRGLYRYAISRGYAVVSPLPTTVPRRPPAFVPYIYSREELRRLLGAADEIAHPPRWVEPLTLRTILLLLYGAGLRVSEALSLNCSDIDFGSSVVTIRDSKFFKSRLAPLGGPLVGTLRDYAAWRQANHSASDPRSPFFVARNGTRLRYRGLNRAFLRVRDRALIRRGDGARYQPRMHDLRHTFAVHRLTQWYRQGADVQKLLPHLSVYLGHRRLASTQVYLSMTPELLEQASLRFERYAHQEESDD
jgi:site-specific recombinase XerD